MDYNHITAFFGNLRNIVDKSLFKNDLIIKIIKDNTKINLNNKDLSIRNGILYIKISPLARGEILMNKDIILKSFKESGLLIRDIH